MEMKQVDSMGMLVDEWTHKSCRAHVGTNDSWATIYMIASDEQGKGHGTELLIEMKKHYEAEGKEFASSVALSASMKHLLQKLAIKEYN